MCETESKRGRGVAGEINIYRECVKEGYGKKGGDQTAVEVLREESPTPQEREDEAVGNKKTPNTPAERGWSCSYDKKPLHPRRRSLKPVNLNNF